jgi:predicted DNA-binding protein (UPF0251 family)
MTTKSHHSGAVRARERERWAAFIRPHWKALSSDGTLEKLEATILSLRLGLVSDHVLTHVQIARRFHISHGTVARIERDARAKVIAALTVEGCVHDVSRTAP